MSVALHVSRELLNHIGRAGLARHLGLFGATIVGEKPGECPFYVAFILDVPGAPEGATRVLPTFRNDSENGNVSVSLVGLDYWDATGHHINAEARDA
jgi:hypothetical protein